MELSRAYFEKLQQHKRSFDEESNNIVLEDEFAVSACKRFKTEECFDQVEFVPSSFMTIEPIVEINSSLPPSPSPQTRAPVHSALCRTSSADTKISIIKEEILNEIQYLRSNFNTSFTDSENDFFIKTELEDIPEEESLIVNNFNTLSESSEYVFYDQMPCEYEFQTDNKNEFSYFINCENICSSIQTNKMNDNLYQKQIDETEEFADNFDFSESNWLESLEELYVK